MRNSSALAYYYCQHVDTILSHYILNKGTWMRYICAVYSHILATLQFKLSSAERLMLLARV